MHVILYNTEGESDGGVHDGEIMNIKRVVDGQPMQKPAKTKSENATGPSSVPVEVTQSSAPVESLKKTETTKEKKGSKAKSSRVRKKEAESQEDQ